MEPRQLADGVLATIVDAAERVSDGFARWDERHVRGPGLYFILVEGEASTYTDPMGANRWPVERCGSVTDDFETFVEAAMTVGTTRDGAVVVGIDGTIDEQMVRLHDLRSNDGRPHPTANYEDWMGTRHMSAIEASVRPNVVATVTLSEEDGRVSVFVDGTTRDSR